MKRVKSTVSYPAPDVLMGNSGSVPGWQLYRGISGSFAVEWVAGFVWNQWQPWSGIRSLAPNSRIFVVRELRAGEIPTIFAEDDLILKSTAKRPSC
ncbi:hypothetical protein HCH_05634 [Hahella chejuensis KCTC 2396]|uniref:Uncharacterized protein n=1 Tax=Hahella chejuensis (strain KCTC 2396) TaxID=349521 RepID=Q2SAN2_HAHCH|nr:hypothetical protein HCH_05634 [Hahella chejuensis KCTC 2396]